MSAEAPAYEDVYMSVNDLSVDPEVQRFHFNPRKVESIVKNFNPEALGIVTVSQRNPVTNIVIDGQHRHEAVRRLTDSTGKLFCRVFTNLTKAEEAQMFLDLNPGNQPTAMDRYRMRLIIGDPTILAVDKAVHDYGWAVHPMPGNAHLQCVKALERIQTVAQRNEATEDILANTMLVVSRAWGNQREAGTAILLEGIAAFLTENRSKKQFDQDRLINTLQNYHSGPFGLVSDTQQIARMRRMRPAMALADTVTKEYNRGLKVGGSSELPEWRRSR